MVLTGEFTPQLSSASTRTDWKRWPQKYILGPLTEPGITVLSQLGVLEQTILGERLRSGEEYYPDDLTVAGMELCIQGIDGLLNGNARIYSYIMKKAGDTLDAADGEYARRKKMSSVEGGIFDVVIDRATEEEMWRMIVEDRDNLGLERDTNAQDLTTIPVTFYLSTLSKACAEIIDVKKSGEGKAGSMFERRSLLGKIAFNLGRARRSHDASYIAKADNWIGFMYKQALCGMQQRLDYINGTVAGRQLAYSKQATIPGTAEFMEATKYYAITQLARNNGFDPIAVLNQHSNGIYFPEPEEMLEISPQIGLVVQRVQRKLDSYNIKHSLYPNQRAA